jgi:hypothetical protein
MREGQLKTKPAKFDNPETRKAFLEGIRSGDSIEVACARHYISPMAFYRTKRSDESFAMEYAAARAEHEKFLTDLVMKSLEDGGKLKTIKTVTSTTTDKNGDTISTTKTISEQINDVPVAPSVLAILRQKRPLTWEPALQAWENRDKKSICLDLLNDDEWYIAFGEALRDNGLSISELKADD